MNVKKGKSINSLMKHIRECHHIEIKGSDDKKQLINMGYYHGYKGYRFYRTIQHPFQGITNFSQIVAIAEFDQQVKAIFYPITMQFENIIKNVIVSKIVRDIDPSFDNIYRTRLTYYRSTNGINYHNAVNKRLKLKKIVDGTIANEYRNNNKIITHYIDNYKPVPLWALFEVLSLGSIGQLMWTLRVKDRRKIAKFFNVYDTQFDPNADFIRQSIYVIRDLRNAIAHNHIIFDCRFKGPNTRISRNLQGTIQNKINLSGDYNFKAIIDYLILLLIILKESGTSKDQLVEYVNDFEDSVEKLYRSTRLLSDPLPYSIYNKIIGENFKNKLCALKQYISA